MKAGPRALAGGRIELSANAGSVEISRNPYVAGHNTCSIAGGGWA
jgi:hypothetical protein